MATQKIEAKIQGGTGSTGVRVGDTVNIDFVYSTIPDSKGTGFDFSAFFDSTELQFTGFTAGAAGGFVSDQPADDSGASTDNNAETDKFVSYSGQTTDFTNPNFPVATQPVTLATATFTVLEGFDGAPINLVATPGGDASGVLFTPDPVSLALTLDVPPVANGTIPDQTVNEDFGTTTLGINLGDFFSDANGDAITFAVTSDTTDIVTAVIENNQIKLTSVADKSGTANLKVTATSNGQSVDSSFKVAVNPVNDAPVFVTPTSSNSFALDTEQTITITGISVGPDDEKATQTALLSYTITGADGTVIASGENITPNSDGTANLTFTPTAANAGDATVAVTVKDNGGTDNGGVDTSTQNFGITIKSGEPDLTTTDNKTLDVSGSDGNISYSVKQASSKTVSDIGFFKINSDGTVGADQVILSTIFNDPTGFDSTTLARVLGVSAGDKLGFFVTTDAPDTDPQTFRSTDENSKISVSDVDGDGLLDIKFADDTTDFIIGTTSLDSNSASTADTADDGSAVIDLTGQGDKTFSVEIFRQAKFDNIVGVYNIDALTGENLTPGAAGFDSTAYTNAAIDNLTNNITVGQGDGAIASTDVNLTGDNQYGVFIITDVKLADGVTVEQALQDARDGNSQIYFPFLGANSDNVSHLKLLGDNVIGIEDLEGGGDKDFNDVIIKLTDNTGLG
jgi:Domain of unknown function (DUF4114)